MPNGIFPCSRVSLEVHPHHPGAPKLRRSLGTEDHREHLDKTSDILLRRETIEREQFV